MHGLVVGDLDVPLGDGVGHGAAVHGGPVGVQQTATGEFTQDGHDAAGAVHVFDVDVGHRGGDLAQARHLARHAVDVGHGEVDASFAGSGQQVQHGVGGAAHGDVERDGVLEGFEGGDVARQRALVVLLVVALGQLDDGATGLAEQLLAVGVGGQRGAVARQGQAQRFGQAVHGVGREHAGAGATGRAGRALDGGHFLVGTALVSGLDHGIHQVERDDLAFELDLAGFHRTAGDEDHGDVQAQRGHQHARGDLVAVGDAHQRVGCVGIAHVLDAVGDQVARGQRIQHAAVAHGDAVVHGDGVEFLGHTTGCLDLAGDQLAQVLQMHVTGHELCEAVRDGDDRLLEVTVLHAGGTPQGTGTGHVAAGGGGTGTVLRHGGAPG